MAKVTEVPVTDEYGNLIYKHRMLSCSKCGHYPLETSIDYCRNCLSKQYKKKKKEEKKKKKKKKKKTRH